MTRREQRGLGRCGLWDELLEARDQDWLDLLAAQPDESDDWRGLARRGGFPTPAVHLRRAADRTIWFDGYVRTYLERDLQDLSAVAALPDFRRLMRAACFRLGQLLNQTELGRDVALPQPTVHHYLKLLETSYLLVRLPAYAVNGDLAGLPPDILASSSFCPHYSAILVLDSYLTRPTSAIRRRYPERRGKGRASRARERTECRLPAARPRTGRRRDR
jgi:hypothetical protein